MRGLMAGGFGWGMVGAVALSGGLLVAGVYIQQERNAQRAVQELVPTEVVQSAAPVNEAQSEPARAVEAEAPEVMAIAPEFDEVRREADGVTVIAGRGAPGATVRILQNGEEIASSTVDRSGKFATIAMIPPDGRGHSLSLSQIADGAEQASEGEVLLAPVDPVVPLPAAPAPPAQIAEAPVPPASVSAVNAGQGTPEAPAAPQVVADASVEDAAVPAAAPQQTLDAAAPAETSVASTQTPGQELSDVPPTVQDTTQTVASAEPLRTTSGAIAELVAADNRIAEPPQKPQVPAALRSTAQGVELLNPEAPEVMDNVALDTISYSAEGDVQLAGRAQSAAASVRVYLNNNAKVDLPVDAAGRWRGDVPDVDEGIYTLRVDEVTSDGKVSSRVETPFKREAVEVLAAAAAAQDGPIKAITVQKGATLWAIARDRYGAGELYVRVFEANKDSIRDPDLIYPGQIFALPQ